MVGDRPRVDRRRRAPDDAGRVRGAAAGPRRRPCRRWCRVRGRRLTAPTLRRPARGVAAGQAIVVAYRPDRGGDIVLGSATIAGAARMTGWPLVPLAAGDRRRLAARHRHRRRGQDGLRRAAGSAAPARAAGPRPRRRHDRPGRRSAHRPAGGALRRALAGRVARGRDLRRTHDLLERDLDALDRGRRSATPGRSRCRRPGRGRSPPASTCRSAARCCTTTAPTRDLAASLADGLRAHVAEVAARLPRRDGRAATRRAVAAGGPGRPGADRERAADAALGRRRSRPRRPAYDRRGRGGAGRRPLLCARCADRAVRGGRGDRGLARPGLVDTAGWTRWASSSTAAACSSPAPWRPPAPAHPSSADAAADGERGLWGRARLRTAHCSPSGSWSPRPVVWPGRPPRTPGRRWPPASRPHAGCREE